MGSTSVGRGLGRKTSFLLSILGLGLAWSKLVVEVSLPCLWSWVACGKSNSDDSSIVLNAGLKGMEGVNFLSTLLNMELVNFEGKSDTNFELFSITSDWPGEYLSINERLFIEEGIFGTTGVVSNVEDFENFCHSILG